jgi:hypothetical protein
VACPGNGSRPARPHHQHAGATGGVGLPDPAAQAIGADLVARHDGLIAEYDEKIARYRPALDAGEDQP